MPALRIPAEYKAHLQKCFQFIKDNTEIASNNSNVSESAVHIYSKLKESGRDTWAFKIDPPWQITIVNDDNLGKRSGLALLGAEISVRNLEIRFYSLSMCIVAGLDERARKPVSGEVISCCLGSSADLGNGRIMRRFHFDIDTEDVADPRPVCHLQHGGKAGELDSVAGGFHYCGDPWLEKPRFAFPPIDIIILLDIILRQFGTRGGRKLTQEQAWQDLVRRSEDMTQRRYFERIYNYITQRERDGVLYEKVSNPIEEWI